jgi:hypothetical protein
MNQILPHRIWIGHTSEEQDFKLLFDTGIRALVSLAVEEPPRPTPRELIFCRFPLVDGAGNNSEVLSLAIRTVAALIRDQVATLICCGGGVSRAPAIAAAGLANVLRQSPAECLSYVVTHHACDVSPGLWDDVTALLPSLG